jgi:hypothetical protein
MAKLPPKQIRLISLAIFLIEQEICNKMFPSTCNGQNRAKFCPFYFFEKT